MLQLLESNGPNGNYLFELEAHAGKPEGWSVKKTGSWPIGQVDRPQEGTAHYLIAEAWLLAPHPRGT